MKIGVYANILKDISGDAVLSILTILEKHGVTIYLSDELRCFNHKYKYFCREELARNTNIIIVLGGDGTILRIAKECAIYGTKIFAINLGFRGFLAEENENIANQIASILNNDYTLDARRLLIVEAKGSQFLALNEAVLARGPRTKTIKYEISINQIVFDNVVSDGVIISTPTGSTAYNISAGGPIIAPNVEAFVFTPISAHSLHSRPIVVNNDSEIVIKLLNAEPNAHLNVDGEDVLSIAVGEYIVVKKSDLYANFIRKNDYEYLSRLSKKMRKWSEI